MTEMKEVTLYLRSLQRAMRTALVNLNQDLVIGQSRFQVLSAQSALLADTLSNADNGVITVCFSTGGTQFITSVSATVRAVALSTLAT